MDPAPEERAHGERVMACIMLPVLLRARIPCLIRLGLVRRIRGVHYPTRSKDNDAGSGEKVGLGSICVSNFLMLSSSEAEYLSDNSFGLAKIIDWGKRGVSQRQVANASANTLAVTASICLRAC